MKYKYLLTIEIESDTALKAVDKAMLQEHRVMAFVKTVCKKSFLPYVCVNWLNLKKANIKT